MNLFRMLIIMVCCCAFTAVSAQKKLIKKANALYKNNQYKDAIDLYEQALNEKESLSLSTRLAYCYRMTNQMAKAEEWYTKVVEDEKAKPIVYFYYAESLMSNGKYDLAKNWFLKYNEKEPEDKNAIRMAYACDKVKTLEPYFKNVEIQSFEHNSDVDESSPLYINNGIAFTSDRSSGINPLKQKSGWTGRDYQRIYFSSKDTEGNYSAPINFSKKLNDLNKHCGPVSFTKDKKKVIFTRTGQVLGKNKSYNIQLYSAESDDGKKWKNIKLLSICNKEHNYMHPAISPDGKKLFFISDRPGGIGGTDVYMTEQKGDGWGRVQNLGPIINTPANEAFPFFHESGKLFFCSKGHLSFGGFDILFSNKKDDGFWQKPVNVGKPINSSYDDISIFLNESMDSGAFSSSRDGGDDDIYFFKVLDGTNATLESLDFEEIAEVPETVKESNEHIIEESLEKVVPPSIESHPVETIKDTPDLLINEEVENFHKSLEKVTEPNEEPIGHSTTIQESIPDRKVEIFEPVSKEPIQSKAPEMNANIETSKSNLSESKKPSKHVNLIIPSKKKQINKSNIEEVIQPTEEEVSKVEPSVHKAIEDEKSIQVDNTVSHKSAILDSEPMESKPPVLLGDESSMMKDEVMKLPKLAELLQTKQTIPHTGFVVDGLNYPKGSYLLSPEGTRSLSAVIDLMNKYPELKIEISSHTSARGNDINNHNLSRKRAMSIMAFLVYKGIANDRIIAKGYGETQLLNTCSNGVNCSKVEHEENDRIEVKVLGN